MKLSDADCYRALCARDPRFDGLFVTGVTSTGIFCRPVCPARTPRRENTRFFALAAQASGAGFRPCLRCRPELAPGASPLATTSRLVQRTLGLLDGGSSFGGSLASLASDLGVSARHLRRVFRRELGVTPVAYLQTRRLLLAKQLLTDTRLPVTEVAFASGFSSVRRFNALFLARCRLDPTALRREARSPGTRRKPAEDVVRLELSFRPPLPWEPLLRFLSERSTPGVELVEGDSYLRTVALADHVGLVRVDPPGQRTLPISLSPALVPSLPHLLPRLRALFDLDARPVEREQHLSVDPRLLRRLRRAPGLRIPGAFDGFELAVRVVLGQQVSIKSATTLAGRLADAFGARIDTGNPALSRAMPSAQVLSRTAPPALVKLGILPARARSIVALARAVADRSILLEPGADPRETIARLEALEGLGPWTAQLIALRALRDPDALPHGDLWLRRALGVKNARAVLREFEAFRPFRALAATALWTYPDLRGS